MNGAASSRSPAALLRRGPLAARAQQPAMPVGFSTRCIRPNGSR